MLKYYFNYFKTSILSVVAILLLLTTTCKSYNGEKPYEPIANTVVDINDSLPYRVCKKKFDSLSVIRSYEIQVNDSRFKNGTTLGLFGLQQLYEKINPNGSFKESEINYLEIKFFNIKKGKYIKVENGKSYILNDSYNKIDSISYRFNSEKKALLFPLNKSVYNFVNILFWIFLVVYGILAIWVCFALPISIIADISRGKPFDESNYKNLRLATNITLLFLFISLCIQIIGILFIFQKINSYFTIDWYANFEFYRNYLIFILILYILSNAFKRGTLLQKENDLTI